MTNKEIKDSEYDESIIKCWDELKFKPVCIVFDLDYTLWPYLIDCDMEPPFRKKLVNKQHIIIDHKNQQILPFEEVTKVLRTLKKVCFEQSKQKHFMAIASKATVREMALELITFFGWYEYFDSYQIHSGIKTIHMKTILDELKLIDYNQILFFDDTRKNVQQTEEIGVTGHYLNRTKGLTVSEFNKGLKKYDLKMQGSKKV